MQVQYTIQMASKISGVGVHTIRAWEKRYKAIVPHRDESGHRSYSKQDIEKLMLLNDLCLLGMSISKIAHFESSELKKLLKEMGKNVDSVEQQEFKLVKGVTEIDPKQSLMGLMLALRNYKLDIITHEISKLKLLLNSREFALEILSPLMKQLGDAVQSGQYSISQEHAMSAILRFHVGHSLFRNFDRKEKKKFTVLICGIEGDYHEFGILQAALLCSHYEMSFYYLGPNLPGDSLLDAMKSIEYDLVIVGATASALSFPEQHIYQYIDKILSKISNHASFIFGGPVQIKMDKLKSKNTKKFRTISSMLELDSYLAGI